MKTCKVCKIERQWIRGKRRNTTNRLRGFVYYDERGYTWQGAVCRSCFSTRYTSKPEDNNVYKPVYRKCRECGQKTVNYFKCQGCWEGKLDYTIDIESAYGYHNAGGWYGG
jgi:hypothetical protein